MGNTVEPPKHWSNQYISINEEEVFTEDIFWQRLKKGEISLTCVNDTFLSGLIKVTKRAWTGDDGKTASTDLARPPGGYEVRLAKPYRDTKPLYLMRYPNRAEIYGTLYIKSTKDFVTFYVPELQGFHGRCTFEVGTGRGNEFLMLPETRGGQVWIDDGHVTIKLTASGVNDPDLRMYANYPGIKELEFRAEWTWGKDRDNYKYYQPFVIKFGVCTAKIG
jgi:hypothetical protein